MSQASPHHSKTGEEVADCLGDRPSHTISSLSARQGGSRFSEEFGDPVKLLQVAEQMGLEGVVSKRKNAPYRSWPRADWVKVKTKVWREANKDRGELFQPERRVRSRVTSDE